MIPAFARCLALLAIVVLAGCAAPRPHFEPLAGNQPFAKDINAFTAADATNPPPSHAILFIGSSSIRLWKTLKEDFPDLSVINRGFGGSQMIDSVNYAERIVLPYKPRHIVIYAGVNDINAKKTPSQVLTDFKAFVAKVHAALPRTKISFIALSPNPARWSQIKEVRETNRIIEEYTRTDSRLAFIDTFSHMLGSDGQPLPDIYVSDRLHMNPKGYRIWTEVIRKHL